MLNSLGFGDSSLQRDVVEQVEIETKYGGYIERQQTAVNRMERVDSLRIPEWFDYDQITGLRFEACFKLNHFRPQTLGQASRIDGVTPADMALIIVYLERVRGTGGQMMAQTNSI